MSVTDVTSRIGQIQSQLALLAPRATANTSSAFALSLRTAATPSVPGLPGAAGTSTSGEAVVAAAKKYLGVPYVWGGTDPAKGLDCSGLVQQVYEDLGYDLPRVSYQQAEAGRPVTGGLANAQPGDILAWFYRFASGVQIGSITVSLTGIFWGLVVFVIGFFVTRWFQGWLDGSVMARCKVDAGVRNSIRTVVGYAGIALAVLVGFSAACIDFSSLALK